MISFAKIYIYVLLWCIYYLQGGLFPRGGAFTQFTLSFLLIFSSYYFFVAVFKYELPQYFIGLNTLLFVLFIYGMYPVLSGNNPAGLDISSHAFLKRMMASILPIYVFFVWTKENILSEKRMYGLILLLFVFSIAHFYGNYLSHDVEISDKISFTNNSGYYFVSIIPACVFLKKNVIIQYLLLFFCLLFAFMSAKRGAIIIGSLCACWTIWKSLVFFNTKQKILMIACLGILISLGDFFVRDKIENNLYLQRRLEYSLEGNAGGRDILYDNFINYYWNETHPLHFMFGLGAYATTSVSTNYAHNDWLEFAIDLGMFGVAVYLFYWFIFFRTILKTKNNDQIKLALQLIFIIYFMQTFFSMSIEAMSTSATMVLGYCLAKQNDENSISS